MANFEDVTRRAKILSDTRRNFLTTGAAGLGALYLATQSGLASGKAGTSSGRDDQLSFARDPRTPLSVLSPQFRPRAKRVIFLHMGGAPSQLELFDHKPTLTKFTGKPTPPSLLIGKRFAFISGIPKLMGSHYPFHQSGQAGAWISDRMPNLEKHIDDLTFIKSMRTDQFNHAPAQLLFQTGNARLGSASMGSWVTYGLGTENQNLPGYIVLLSGEYTPDGGKQLWGSGYLPSAYQGVECRSDGDPVLYLSNPDGVSRTVRRNVLNAVDKINNETFAQTGDNEIVSRIAQYEMAFRMQTEASEAMDIKKESAATLAKYGAVPGKRSFANNALVARRLAERGVRFIQLYHLSWDAHGGSEFLSMENRLSKRCEETDQAVGALLSDLKERGLMKDTLIVWGGEFGRTSMQETRPNQQYPGRDHNPDAFTVWLSGGGVKGGYTHGETDDLGYQITKSPVDVRDLHATILYLLGYDYKKLSFDYQGLAQKLTGVLPAKVVGEILA